MFAYVIVELSPHYNSFVRRKNLPYYVGKKYANLL